MSTPDIGRHIEELVAEEESLRAREADEERPATAEERERLEAIRVELDRTWDLLRRRRALAEAGRDPDEAGAPRDADTVEGYEQ